MSPLNNERLVETPLPAAEYNKLPHIDDMRDAAANNAKAHAVLLGLIAANGLADKFSVHLVHKHFDIPEGRVMVYENVSGKNHGDFLLSSPRVPEKTENLRGLYFKAAQDGSMFAYEYTNIPGMDLSGHEDFVAQFSAAVIEHGVQDVFALTAVSISPAGTVFNEFEMNQYLSTVLVSNPSWLPTADFEAATSTDWPATEDYAQYADGKVPGMYTLKCTKTRTTHYNFTCSRTRSGTHYETQNKMNELYMNDEVIPEGTEQHAIVSHAMELVAACA